MKRYTPRRKPTQPPQDNAERRTAQLATRLKAAGLRLDDHGQVKVDERISKVLAEAGTIGDPQSRLTFLLDFADQYRSTLSNDALRWVLPESINDWRTG